MYVLRCKHECCHKKNKKQKKSCIFWQFLHFVQLFAYINGNAARSVLIQMSTLAVRVGYLPLLSLIYSYSRLAFSIVSAFPQTLHQNHYRSTFAPERLWFGQMGSSGLYHTLWSNTTCCPASSVTAQTSNSTSSEVALLTLHTFIQFHSRHNTLFQTHSHPGVSVSSSLKSLVINKPTHMIFNQLYSNPADKDALIQK